MGDHFPLKRLIRQLLTLSASPPVSRLAGSSTNRFFFCFRNHRVVHFKQQIPPSFLPRIKIWLSSQQLVMEILRMSRCPAEVTLHQFKDALTYVTSLHLN